MSKNFDCMREIMIMVDKCLSEDDRCSLNCVAHSLEYGNKEIYFATKSLEQAGFIGGVFDHSDLFEMLEGSYNYITPQGYEWLSTVKDNGKWGKIVSFLKEKGIELSFSAIQTAAAALSLAVK